MAEEERIGSLARVSGHTFDTIYDLVFTTERIIAVIVEHPGDIPQTFGMMEMLVGGHLGKQAERVERKRIAQERRRAYEEKGLSELVGLHRLNFAIPYSEVLSIQVKQGLLQSSLTFRLSGQGGSHRAIRFRLQKGKVAEARQIVALTSIAGSEET